MTRRNLIIAILLGLCGAALAQRLESARSLAFDRGVVDASEPLSASGNPALLLLSSFRFYGELQRTANTSFFVSILYPVSAGTGMGLSWHIQTQQEIRALPAAIIGVERDNQSLLISLGHRNPINWGQQIEMAFESNRQTFQYGSEAAKQLFDDDQLFTLKYRLGFRHQLSEKLAVGLLTPPILSMRYRAFINSSKSEKAQLDLGKEIETGVRLPMAALTWKLAPALTLAFSSRSLRGKTDMQLAAEKRLAKHFVLTAAATTAPESKQAKLTLGLGGYLKGFDTFAAYDIRRQDFRFAISLAPERNKELIAVPEIKPAARTLYLYRLKHRDPAELATVELVNATTKTVEINIQCSGHNLPKLNRGLALTGSEHAGIAIPAPHALQDLPAGAYEYEVKIVAFQRGRQEIKRQLIFEMKDAHDWSGDSRDLNYFIQSADDEILKTARLLLARSQVNSRPDGVAECFYNFFRDSLRYVHDPQPLRLQQDRVQYAVETLRLKSGDCEDLTILMVSLLASVGIQAAFADVA
ncbi:MAG: transglutaminase-like domain-containing protein, partial [bacterium]